MKVVDSWSDATGLILKFEDGSVQRFEGAWVSAHKVTYPEGSPIESVPVEVKRCPARGYPGHTECDICPPDELVKNEDPKP